MKNRQRELYCLVTILKHFIEHLQLILHRYLLIVTHFCLNEEAKRILRQILLKGNSSNYLNQG